MDEIDWIRYANQQATRDQPLDPDLIRRLQFLQDMGVTAEVFSGGQLSKGPDRVGSHRHDHGGSGDIRFYKGKRRLNWANKEDLPIFEEIVRKGKAAGITGFGAGPGYMEPGTMHVGMGSPAVWGAEGKGANAPDWLKKAYGMTLNTPPAASILHPEISPNGAAPPVMDIGQMFGQGMGEGAMGAGANAAASMQGINPWSNLFSGAGKALSGMSKNKGSNEIIPTGGLMDDPGKYAAAAALMQALLQRKRQEGLGSSPSLGMTLGM